MPRDNLLDYVSRPPPPTHRIYCTLVPSSLGGVTTSSTQQRNRHPLKYTLYVEHMGNLIPVLEATRRSSKLRPSFTISLPSDHTSSDSLPHTPRLHPETTPDNHALDHSDHHNDTTIRCVGDEGIETHTSINTESGIQLAYKEDDGDISKTPPTSCTPEGQSCVPSNGSKHIAEVSSHIINSKFRIQSIGHRLPSDMGTITIKTSFLHIQPRKVVVHLPPLEADSGVDSDTSSCEDCYGDESDVFTAESADLSLDSLSSMEELSDTNNAITGTLSPAATNRLQDTIAKTPSNHHKSRPSSSALPVMSCSDSNVIIHSKTPTWNEQHMIYQLDFGGRVTTKSAKNFQLEMGTDQVSIQYNVMCVYIV